MRVSREQAEQNRRNVVDVASRRFLEQGLSGANIAGIMKEVGLTHGGFYAQFDSKDALEAEAVSSALARSARRWRRWSENAKAPLREIFARYLSKSHCDNPAAGCALAALAGEVGRSSNRALKKSFARGVGELAGILADANDGGPRARREKSLAQLSAMVGAVMLARAVDDPKLADEILRAARSA